MALSMALSKLDPDSFLVTYPQRPISLAAVARVSKRWVESMRMWS
jgi:hypothetical protein